jgi:hypothetical protein
MKSLWMPCVALVLAGGALTTDYTKERSLRVEITSSMSLETKSMKVERNGEPMEVAGGMTSTAKRTITYVDKTLEHKDGAPTKVQRAFEDLANESSTTFGDRQADSAMKPRLSGVTLELTRAGDEIEVKATEGDAEDEALEGHTLPLLLDAFLPSDDAESWELDDAAIKRGLALDVQKALFAPPEPQGGAEGEGRGRGRSRGPGGSTSGLLSLAQLEGKATRAAETAEHNGVECVVIELEIKGSGDLPTPEAGSGGRGGVFEPAQPLVLLGNTYDIELKGRLLYDATNKLPVRLELEGTIELEQSSERTFNDMTIKSESVVGGDLEFEIAISKVDD